MSVEGEHDRETRPRRDGRATPVAPRRPGSGGLTGGIVALQRQAGNRAVAKLAKRRRPNPRAVPITFVPEDVMSPRELAIFLLQRLYGESASAAEARLDEYWWEGPTFGKYGVTEAMVRARKPITVSVVPARISEGERGEMQIHAEDLAAAGADERRLVNAETDRRFWQRIGDSSHPTLGLGAEQQGQRELWMATREQVMQDRDRVLGLPEPMLDFIEPDGENPDPATYAAALRIAEKAKGFTEADWARYERNAVGTTSDMSDAEAAVEHFAAQRADEQRIADRLTGTEELFTLWHSNPADVTVAFKEMQAKAWLNSYLGSFKTIGEYDVACQDYLRVFRDRAVEIARLALRASDRIVRAEQARYRDSAEVAAVYHGLTGMRRITDDYTEERRRETDQDTAEAMDDPGYLESRFGPDIEAERARLAIRNPIIADHELTFKQLTVQDPQSLGESLRDDAAERLKSIEKTWDRLDRDPDAVFHFPRVVEATKSEMGIERDSIHAMIVDDRLREIRSDDIFWAIAGTVLAIGLAALTFGTGTVAVLAAGAMLAQSVYTGVEEVKAYGDAYAAAHSAFDSSQTLSADSPSAFWAAFALIAAGLDGINLINSLSMAGKALHVLELTQNLEKFDAQMLEDFEQLPKKLKKALAPEVRAILKRAMKARKQLDKLTRTLRRELTGGAKLSPRRLQKAAASVSKCGYHGAQLGMKEFDQFLTLLQEGLLQRIEFGKFSGEEMAVLREAWEKGVGKAEKAGVAIKPGSAKPAEGDEWAADTEVDLDPAGAKASDEPPLATPFRGFRTRAEVEAAVLNAFEQVRGDIPPQWYLVKRALEQSKASANRELAALVDAYMDALRNPAHWADVLGEAWERAAKMKSPDIRKALIEMATERIGPPLETPRDVLGGRKFFRDYVTTGRPIVDIGLKDKAHGELAHLIQDLVIDRALGKDKSASFRRLLGKAEGTIRRDSEFGMTRHQIFVDPEVEIRTGDYVWRFTYDLLYNDAPLQRLPQPEAVGPILFRLFGPL